MLSPTPQEKASELAEMLAARKLGWLPTGPCMNVTITPEERHLLVDVLRAFAVSESGESDAWARLRAVQQKLVDAGVRDVKFHFAIGPETPASKVAADAADLLEAHLMNATGAVCGPLPVKGHKTASVDAADERTPEEAAHHFQFDIVEKARGQG